MKASSACRNPWIGEDHHHALADRGRRVRHAAHERRRVSEDILERRDRRAGGDRQEDGAAIREAAVGGGHVANDLGLDRKHDQARRAVCRNVARLSAGGDAETAGARAQFGTGLDHEDLRGGEPAGVEPTGKHRVAHIAAADENCFDGHPCGSPFLGRRTKVRAGALSPVAAPVRCSAWEGKAQALFIRGSERGLTKSESPALRPSQELRRGEIRAAGPLGALPRPRRGRGGLQSKTERGTSIFVNPSSEPCRSCLPDCPAPCGVT